MAKSQRGHRVNEGEVPMTGNEDDCNESTGATSLQGQRVTDGNAQRRVSDSNKREHKKNLLKVLHRKNTTVQFCSTKHCYNPIVT